MGGRWLGVDIENVCFWRNIDSSFIIMMNIVLWVGWENDFFVIYICLVI